VESDEELESGALVPPGESAPVELDEDPAVSAPDAPLDDPAPGPLLDPPAAPVPVFPLV